MTCQKKNIMIFDITNKQNTRSHGLISTVHQPSLLISTKPRGKKSSRSKEKKMQNLRVIAWAIELDNYR